MSELQVSLIVLGGVIILGVVAYNWWQDKRIRQKMQKHLPMVEEDPLLRESGVTTTRKEPGLTHLGLESEDDGSRADVARHEASVESNQALAEPDPLIEEVIEIVLTSPRSGEELLAALRDVRSFGVKPVRMFVQTDQGVLSTRVNPSETYMALHLAVLLANRAGPLSPIEWSQIWGKACELAEVLEARVDGRDQHDVVEKAQALDGMCADLDMQVGLNLLLDGARDTEDLIQCAMGMGFIEHEGELAWVGEHGLACFTLNRFDGHPFEAGAQLDKLSLLLDVPRSPATDTSFARMVDVGTELARRLGAVLVDDQGKPLAQGAEIAIDERLQVLYGQLDAAGLQAGGERARRVFA